jgi:hypothetical protein
MNKAMSLIVVITALPARKTSGKDCYRACPGVNSGKAVLFIPAKLSAAQVAGRLMRRF